MLDISDGSDQLTKHSVSINLIRWLCRSSRIRAQPRRSQLILARIMTTTATHRIYGQDPASGIIASRERDRHAPAGIASMVLDILQRGFDILPAVIVVQSLCEGAENGDAAVNAADLLAVAHAFVVVHLFDDIHEVWELVLSTHSAVR